MPFLSKENRYRTFVLHITTIVTKLNILNANGKKGLNVVPLTSIYGHP